MKLVRFLPRFRQAYQSLRSLAEHEQWERAVVEAYQLQRLNKLWEHAIEHVPFYRRLRTQANLPNRFRDLTEFRATVPILPKSLVRDNPDDFGACTCCNGRWHLTSGSTGTPTRVYRSKDAHLETLRAKYRFYQTWGIDIFDRTVFLWGNLASFAPGMKGKITRVRQPIEDRLRNRLRLSAYDLDQDNLRHYLQRIKRFRPAAIYAFSMAAYLLALEAERTGFVSDSLKAIILAGEPASPNIIGTVQHAFGLPAAVEYGSCECGFLAGQSRDDTMRVREDSVLLETLPRDDGRFDIIVTPLNNPCFPLIRYAIGDVTDEALEYPQRGFAILNDVAGRDNDVILTRNGHRLHPSRMLALFDNNRAIRRYCIHQAETGALSVLLELDCAADARHAFHASSLERQLVELVDGYPATVRVVDSIPSKPTGKHRFIESAMAAKKVNTYHERSRVMTSNNWFRT
jgi:phenylacetate-CoA ligase